MVNFNPLERRSSRRGSPFNYQQWQQENRTARRQRFGERERLGVRQAAGQTLEQQVPVVLPQPIVPTAPPEQQALFEQTQVAQRPTTLPFGIKGPSVYSPTAQEEKRAQPEFGSWFGSGMAEAATRVGLGVLENFQKGIETIVGTGVRGIGAVTPGDFLGYEGSLREVKKEREGGPSFFDLPGQAQLTAEAFRRTDMPTTRVTLPFKIDLPGDKTFHQVDFGVKGALELLPDAILAVLTGGTSVGASAARSGLGAVGRGVGRGVMGATGADIVVGAARGATRKIKGAPDVKAPDLPNIENNPWGTDRVLSIETNNQARGRINEKQSPAIKEFIGAIPDGGHSYSLKGAVTWAMNKISPNILLDTSDELAVAGAAAMRNLGTSEPQIAYTMARFFNEVNAKTFPEKVLKADPEWGGGKAAAKIRKSLEWAKPKGQEMEQATGFGINDYGNIVGTGSNLDGKAWSIVAENFWKGESVTVSNPKYRKGLDLGTAVWRDRETNEIVTKTGRKTQKYSYVDTFEGGKHSKIAHFMTTYRYYTDDVKRMLYENRVGEKEIRKAEAARRKGAGYGPRYPYDANFMLQIEHTGASVRRGDLGERVVAGTKPRSLIRRKFTDEQLQDAINKKQIKLHDPFETMENLLRGAYRISRDGQLNRSVKAVAHSGGSRIIDQKYVKSLKGRVKQTLSRKGRVSKKTGVKGAPARVSKKQIDNLRKHGLHHLAAAIEGNAGPVPVKGLNELSETARKKRLKHIENIFDKDIEQIQGSGPWYQIGGIEPNSIPTRNGRLPEYVGLLFRSKEEAEDLLRKIGEDKKGIFATSIEGMGETGDTIRVGKTGFDFGFPLIQGLPALGVAASTFLQNPALGARLFHQWGRAALGGFEASRNPEVLTRNIIENLEVVSEAVQTGRIQLSRQATDIFIAVQNQTIFGRMGGPGVEIDELVKTLAAPFERAYVSPGDILRIEYYKALRDTAWQSGIAKGGDGYAALADLGSFVNKMTGAINPLDSGIAPTQSMIERNIMFFSQRYTRGSVGLLKNFVDGGIEGELARRAITGMLALGMGTYIGLSEALKFAGVDHEAHLDPSKSDFMTFKVQDDVIGLGTFWTQFARLTAKLSKSSYDEKAKEQFWQMDDNPIVRFLRGRSAPVGGLAWDIAERQDYMGKNLVDIGDWTKHLSLQATPIWVEAMLLDSPYRTGPVGGFGEFFGGRIRPLSAAERRRSLRNEIAISLYDKSWDDLNQLQQKKIRGYDNVSDADARTMDELDLIIKEERGEIGDKTDLNIDRFWDRRKEINLQWNNTLVEGLTYLEADAITPSTFRDYWLRGANAERRGRVQNELHNEEGEFALALEQFNKNSTLFGPDSPEDVAYLEYINNIVAEDGFIEADGFNFLARNKAVEDFRMKWGDEVYSYVQQLFAEGREMPSIVHEYYQGRNHFEYYWTDVEATVLEQSPDREVLTLLWNKWLGMTNTDERDALEENNKILKSFKNKISKVRVSMREQNKELDAWLYRWGFTNTLRHRDNDFEGSQSLYRHNGALPLEHFGIVPGIRG